MEKCEFSKKKKKSVNIESQQKLEFFILYYMIEITFDFILGARLRYNT